MSQETVTRIIQKPVLSPEQILTMNLVGKSTDAVEETVIRKLNENPSLDPTDEAPATDKDEISSAPARYRGNWSVNDEEGKSPREAVAAGNDFREDLEEQFQYCIDDEKTLFIGKFIINSLDDRGYLPVATYIIADDLDIYHGIHTSEEEVEGVLSIIQSLDPPGIGARDLRECLLLQLNRRPKDRIVELSAIVVRDFFKELSSRNFHNIMKGLSIDEATVRQIRECIQSLESSPAGQEADASQERQMQISPDFTLTYDQYLDRFKLEMTKVRMPAIRVSKFASETIRSGALPGASKEEKEAAQFYKKCTDEANILVKAVDLREDILLKTMRSILEFQREYFKEGDISKLKPMTLEDISQMTGNDISTISRFSNSKYVQTDFGIFPLKHFFSTKMTDKNGEEISNKEIKQVLKEVIDAEDKRNPFTDEELVAEMDKKGYKVARRTVAKYRSQLNVLPASHRREI